MATAVAWTFASFSRQLLVNAKGELALEKALIKPARKESPGH